MPIKGLNDVELGEILHSHLTPSKEINDPARLLGREHHLRQIARTFNSEGRNIFIYGDKGIGKTSLGVTAATVNNFSEETHINVPCGETSTFADVMLSIANGVVPVAQRFQKKRASGGVKLGYAGASVGADYSGETKLDIPRPATVADALDILSFVASSRKGRTVVVVDEFDRIQSPADKVLFAEVLKNLPTRNIDLRFIFCGVGQSVDDIMGAHLSSGRYFKPLELEKLSHDSLWSIISRVASKTKVAIPDSILVRIGLVSDGFPHFVHLIGECMFWAMHDDPAEVETCTRSHYEAGIRDALAETEPPLRNAYQKATEKIKNKLDYEEALWALADRAETRRQLKHIYDHSYIRIMDQRHLGKRPLLSREKLNQRLQALRRPAHGSIVIGTGSGWYRFRENVMRGYVRLKAESEGVELIPDV